MANDRRYRLRWVDVFTERALAGNPLAVVLEADGLSDMQMQAIAITFMALLGAGVAQSESSRLPLGD